MAKRFTDTDKWKKNSFSELSIKMKLAWIYLCDNCDHAGVWDVNFKLMSFHVGEEITEKEFNDAFKKKIKWFSDSKIFIQSFVTFQYGTLNQENRAHKSVIDRLERLGAYKPLKRSLDEAKDKEQDKDQVKDKEKDKVKDQEKEKEKDKESSAIEKLKMHELGEIWNLNCSTLPKIKNCDNTRLKKIKALWPQQTPDEWVSTIKLMAESDFCKGSTGWIATFDWLLKPGNFTKVNEGNYSNKKSIKKTAQTIKYDNLDALEKLWMEKE